VRDPLTGLIYVLDRLGQSPKPDGRPLSVDVEGGVALIPSVSPDGAFLTNQQALQQYFQTRETLGVFATKQEANRAAGVLAGLLQGQRRNRR
jgi:hypothetical protein